MIYVKRGTIGSYENALLKKRPNNFTFRVGKPHTIQFRKEGF